MATILIIDDEPDMLHTLESVVGNAGYRVLAAETGREAEKLIAENPVDLVLTDLVMPDKDGIELIIELRRTHSKVPIVAMSAWGSSAAGDYLKIARTFGARSTLEKPFTRDAVLKAIADVIGPGEPKAGGSN